MWPDWLVQPDRLVRPERLVRPDRPVRLDRPVWPDRPVRPNQHIRCHVVLGYIDSYNFSLTLTIPVKMTDKIKKVPPEKKNKNKKALV